MPPEYAVAVVEQVAGALDAAHAAGLVHYDVKPSNVLVHRPAPGRVPHVVLADFGIAGDPDGLGTVEYLAPERWNALPGDGRVDVYALTCVLHELLTGTRAFAGTEFAAQMHGHLLLPPPRPSAIVPDMPARLDAVIAAGMAKDPVQRVATAGQLAGMARAALAPPRRGPTRRQVLVGAVTGIATLGGGLAVAAALRTPGGGSPPERITPDRVLGIRSTNSSPFQLGTVGDTALAVVLDGSSTESTIQAWDLVTDQAVGGAQIGGANGIAYLAHQLTIAEVDGRGLLCAANAPLEGPYKAVIADLATGQQLATVPVPKPQSVGFTPEGGPALLLLDADGGLARIDLTTRAVTATAPPVPDSFLGSVMTADVGGTPSVLVVGIGAVTAFDATTLAKVAAWPWLVRAAVTVDGRPLGVGVATGAALAVSPPDEQPRLIDVPDCVDVTATVIDGRGIAAVGLGSGQIALFDVVTGNRLNALLTGHQAKISQLGIVHSGERPLLVSAAADNTIRVWDLAVHASGS
jgi:hypothetical protein